MSGNYFDHWFRLRYISSSQSEVFTKICKRSSHSRKEVKGIKTICGVPIKPNKNLGEIAIGLGEKV